MLTSPIATPKRFMQARLNTRVSDCSHIQSSNVTRTVSAAPPATGTGNGHGRINRIAPVKAILLLNAHCPANDTRRSSRSCLRAGFDQSPDPPFRCAVFVNKIFDQFQLLAVPVALDLYCELSPDRAENILKLAGCHQITVDELLNIQLPGALADICQGRLARAACKQPQAWKDSGPHRALLFRNFTQGRLDQIVCKARILKKFSKNPSQLLDAS